MTYKFECEKCKKITDVEIAMSDYDIHKNNQVCSCGGKMKRKLEWTGIATGDGPGWCGKSSGNTI